jgi:hypothetical protein
MGWGAGSEGLSPPAWSLDVSNACRCVFRAFIAPFIAPFIVREAMVEQPELKPRSIDAIRSSNLQFVQENILASSCCSPQIDKVCDEVCDEVQ